MSSGTELAPDGQLWVCLACGKTSKTKYGFDNNNNTVSMRGWDESCMLNSVLLPESCIEERGSDGRVTKAICPTETAQPVSDDSV